MDNSTKLMENISSVVNEISRTVSSKQMLVDGLLSSIGIAAFICNAIALYVIMCSKRIRKSRPYVLLVNQTVIDIVSSTLTVVCITSKYAVLSNWPTTSLGQWITCEIILSQIPFVATSCSSSYNLCALSVERMAGVMWPAIHRAHFNSRNLFRLAVSIWILGAVLMLAHSVPSNKPKDDGLSCHFWAGLGEEWRTKTLAVGFNACFSFVPLIIMIGSYVVIYIRLTSLSRAGGKLPDSVKMNVIKMLATCVLLFFCCHTLRVTLSLASRFTDRAWMKEPIFIAAISLVQSNSMVNPLVYTAQYGDYRRELSIQSNRLLSVCGCQTMISEDSQMSHSSDTGSTNTQTTLPHITSSQDVIVDVK